MENYYKELSRPILLKSGIAAQSNINETRRANPVLADAVMPLYQVIRFANQAAEKKQTVIITIEQKQADQTYLRSTMKGIFRSGVNRNKQVTFESADRKFLHFFSIEQVLAIQIAG